jgi:copper transport protein
VRLVWWRAVAGRPVALIALLAVVALFASATSPAAVSAHARLRTAVPASGATLGSSPSSVTLTFSETPDLRLTSIKVLDSGGTDRVTGAVELVDEPPTSVRIAVQDLPDGVYTVSWRTVSAVDAHISAGTYVFGVGQAPPSTPPDTANGGTSQSGSPPAILARWILYLGLMALVGAAWVALAVARRPAPDLLAMAAVGWLLTAAGTVGVVGVQWAETGAPLEALPSTSIGVAALVRVVSLGVVGFALVALAAIPRLAARGGWVAVAIASVAAIVVDVGTGHAAAGPGWISQVTAQSLHGVSAGTWVGGLAALLVVLRTTPPDARLATARRYSTWAGISLAVLAVTGVVRAITEIGTLDALFGTDFGWVVIAKSVLLLGLAGLGAFNRFVTLRNAARVATFLRRVGAAEITLAIAVLGCSALLVNLSPPASAGTPPEPVAQPIVATGHDFGTSMRARLVATPGAVGANDFELAINDYDTGAPVDASAVELRFELISTAGIGPSSLDLERVGPGRFRANGSNLSIDGIWRVTATVTVRGSAADVPLIVATRIPAQPVDRLVTPGLPTIHTIQLGDAGSVQVYIDPGTPGPNELHVTFFDPNDGELAVESITIAVFPGGGESSVPTPRLLETGHYVASLEAVAGTLEVDAIAIVPRPNGAATLHLHATLEVSP